MVWKCVFYEHLVERHSPLEVFTGRRSSAIPHHSTPAWFDPRDLYSYNVRTTEPDHIAAYESL